MSFRLIQGPLDSRDLYVYNNSGSNIARGIAVKWGTATTVKFDPSPAPAAERGPLEGLTKLTVIPVLAAAAATDRVIGIAQYMIPDGDWGYVRTWGYGIVQAAGVIVAATLKGLGEPNASGQLTLATPGVGSEAYACAMGATTTTAAGDLVPCFIDTKPESSAIADVQSATRVFGSWT
ncbi:MAG: hypothetical protein ACE5EF_00110 [Dehalococcoidia bacterium]